MEKISTWYSNLPTILKIPIGILGTIIVGALGSGTWESLLKPFIFAILQWTSDFFLSINSSLFDKMYRDVPTSDANDLNVLILMFVCLNSLLNIVMFEHSLSDSIRRLTLEDRTTMRHVAATLQELGYISSTEGKSPSEEDREEAVQKLIRVSKDIKRDRIALRRFSRLFRSYTNASSVVILSTIIFLSLTKEYEVSRNKEYRVKYITSLPYMSIREREVIEARFYMIKSKSDYDKIISDLDLYRQN